MLARMYLASMWHARAVILARMGASLLEKIFILMSATGEQERGIDLF